MHACAPEFQISRRDMPTRPIPTAFSLHGRAGGGSQCVLLGETARRPRPAPVLTSLSLRSAGPRGGQGRGPGAIDAESCASKAVGAQRVPRRPRGCSLDPGLDSSAVSSSTEPCCADLCRRSIAAVRDVGAEYAVWGAGESGLWCRKHVRRQSLRWQLLRWWLLRWRHVWRRRQHVRRRRHVRRHERRHERRHVWRYERRWAFWRVRHERAGRQGSAIRDAEHRADAGARRAHSLTPAPSRARASGYRAHSSHTALPTSSSAPRPLSWG